MGEGRGSAAIMVLLCMVAVIYSEMRVNAETYVVGDLDGWGYNVANWTDGKTFKTGDTLVFKYSPLYHNVLRVDEFGYNTCIPTINTEIYFSGDDHIQISSGTTYFICGFPGHCSQHAMKIAVNAS